MISLCQLQNVELIGALFTFAGTDGIFLHATFVPNLKSGMFESENTLGNVRNLVSVMYHSESVWNKIGHEFCKFIVAHSRLSHCVKLVYVFVNVLYVSSRHNC